MTDDQAMRQVLGVIEPAAGVMGLVGKNGRMLMALPMDRGAAGRTLRLYQPQRRAAKAMVAVLRVAVATGIHRRVLPVLDVRAGRMALTPAMPEVIPGTCGVMFGSPEHRVRRAIASFQTMDGWEVAKVAFGAEGREVIQSEASVLRSLPQHTPGATAPLGVHYGPDIALMRMPYFRGRVLRQGDSVDAIALLESWRSGLPAVPITEFDEWSFIVAALSSRQQGSAALAQLSQKRLSPGIRHGDFTRWNLLRTTSRGLIVLDWEWGVVRGMPGMDLVHFFAQDARLVNRLSPAEVIRTVERRLQSDDCRSYLEKCGWQGDVRSAILASIAFTVGATQQANEEILSALLNTG